MAPNHENKAELSTEQQAKLDKIIEQAKQSYVSEDIVNQARAILVKNEGQEKAADPNLMLSVLAGSITNLSRYSLTLLSSKIWAGYSVVDFPRTIDDRPGAFSLAALSGTVKGGAAYVGKNQAGAECVWLVAFAGDNSIRKIYADCGPRRNFENINWTAIEGELNKASSVSTPSDPKTGTSVYATIVRQDPGTVVAAAFNG